MFNETQRMYLMTAQEYNRVGDSLDALLPHWLSGANFSRTRRFDESAYGVIFKVPLDGTTCLAFSAIEQVLWNGDIPYLADSKAFQPVRIQEFLRIPASVPIDL